MSVEERLQALENQARALEAANLRWRRLALGSVTVLALVALGAQTTAPQTIEARGFVLRDGRGAARAHLGIIDDVPGLSLYDAAGTLRAGLAVEHEGPILNLFTADGEPRIVVGERGNTAFIVLRDRAGAPRAAMAIQDDGSPSLYLLDDKMNPLFRKP